MRLNRHLQFTFVLLTHFIFLSTFCFWFCFSPSELFLIIFLIMNSFIHPFFWFSIILFNYFIYIYIENVNKGSFIGSRQTSSSHFFTLFSKHFPRSHRFIMSLSSPGTVTLSRGNNNIAINRFVCDTLYCWKKIENLLRLFYISTDTCLVGYAGIKLPVGHPGGKPLHTGHGCNFSLWIKRLSSKGCNERAPFQQFSFCPLYLPWTHREGPIHRLR